MFFLETSLKINWNLAFEIDENGLKMNPILQLVKGNESLVIYFWRGKPRVSELSFWPPSNHQAGAVKSNFSIGIQTHLKLVSENIFLDYKNTKWNTKFPAYAANRLQQTNI